MKKRYRTPKHVDRFYVSKAWRRSRQRAISRQVANGCAYCGKAFDTLKGIHVDHIIARKDAPHLAHDQSNLRLMHERCHSAHTHSKAPPRAPVDSDGFPPGWQ